MSANRISMKTLQAADKLLGRIACFLLQPLKVLRADPPGVDPPQEILLIKFWGIGSLQLLTPAARSLRRQFPLSRITLLTLGQNEAFARRLGVFDDVRTFDVAGAGWPRLVARILRLCGTLRRARYHRVYDFEFFTRFSAVVSLLTGAREVHGFSAPGVHRGGFHTTLVPFNRYWHVARNFRALAGGENGQEIECSEVTPMSVKRSDDERVRRILDRHGIRGGAPYTVFNPNAGALSLERRWPTGNFAQLARRAVHEDGSRIVLIGTRDEAAYVQRVVDEAGSLPPGHLVNLAGLLSISELGALLRGATCTVTNDSGPMHLSAALGTPTVGLFGPETPTMYAPLGERARALWDPPVCSPCINVHDNKVATCIHGRPECLVNLSVEHVLEELRYATCRSVLRPVARANEPLRHETGTAQTE